MLTFHRCFQGLCLRCSHDFYALSRRSLSGMTLRPYIIFSRPVIVHVSSHPSRPLSPHFFTNPITALSANPFADILDIDTAGNPGSPHLHW